LNLSSRKWSIGLLKLLFGQMHGSKLAILLAISRMQKKCNPTASKMQKVQRLNVALLLHYPDLFISVR
jgi:hypothetical protein